MPDKRINVASWDETFMGIAEVVAKRSKDPSTQVGACIVSADKRVLSVGYNGATHGFDDDEFPWGKTSENILETKHPFVIHAERNAVLNFRGSMREFSEATVYVTHFPCNECAKEIASVGISEVVYLNNHNLNGFSTKASFIILDKAGVKTRLFT